MTIIIFVIVLAVLILVHEFGHFSFAKFFGMRVDEFGIGFPPKIWSRKRGETTYSINAIPFGGFVKIFGEDPDEVAEESSRSFVNFPKSKQAMVLFAGVLFNLLFAWLLFSAGFLGGMPVSDGLAGYGEARDPKLLIVSVASGSPAESAGIKIGDEIVFIESAGEALQLEELTPQSVQDLIYGSGGEDISIIYKRGDENKTAFVTPSYEIVPDKPAVGIVMDKIVNLKLNIFQSILFSAQMTWSIFIATFAGLGYFLLGVFTGTADFSQVAGPVGIVGLVGEASTLGFSYLLSFVAFISINLAVINLIPFPALDGGRLLFVAIEKVKGSRINPKIANTINLLGFIFLILLMVFVTFSDISKIIN